MTGTPPTSLGDRLARVSDWRLAGAVALGTLLVRWWTVGTVPSNWDAIQFGLGVRAFDVFSQQPHAPGYPLFVSTGVMLGVLGIDPLQALAVVSWAFGGLTALPVFALGRSLFGKAAGSYASILYAASPLAWYYGSVGLTYSIEGFFAALFGWQLLRARNGSFGSLVASAAILAVAGGFRPTILVLLGPALLAVFSRRPIVHQGITVSTFFGMCLLWFVPLVVASGGIERYYQANVELARIAGASNSAGHWAGQVLNNVVVTAGSLAYGLHSGFVLLGIWFLRVRRSASSPSTGGSGIADLGLVAWLVVPALLVFAFAHVGQAGYLLIVFPPLLALAGSAADSLDRVLARRNRLAPVWSFGLTCAVISLIGAASFFGNDGFQSARGLAVDREVWSQAATLVADGSAEDTLILTGLWTGTHFRMAQYQFPRHLTQAVGYRPDGGVASLYHVADGRVSQTMPDIVRDGPVYAPLHTDPPVRRIVVLDEAALTAVIRAGLADQFVQQTSIQAGGRPQIWVLERSATEIAASRQAGRVE